MLGMFLGQDGLCTQFKANPPLNKVQFNCLQVRNKTLVDCISKGCKLYGNAV